MQDTQFNNFLDSIDEIYRETVLEIHNFLLEQECEYEMKSAKSGYTVSYIQKWDKKTLANFVCRKTGVKLRLYPRHISSYEKFLDTLPKKMKEDISKASVCKRLINPDDCNPKCVMGYDFYMDGEHYQKCRYMAFQMSLSTENDPYIMQFLHKELRCV